MFTWLTGRAATAIGEPSVEHGDRPDDWPSSVPFRRRPRPLLRVIRWSPPDTGQNPPGSQSPNAFEPTRSVDPAPGQDYDLFVRQRVLREVRSELMGSPEHESFGFLLGRLLYCPWTKTSFVLMDQAWQASGPLPTKDQTLAFREAWTSAWQAARRRRLQVIGWYHSHGLLGLQLSARDMEIHRRYFPDPWQTALIVVPGGEQPLGGFIQRRSALFFAQSLIPFSEVLDADAVWRDDVKPSWVDWENYDTDEAVRIVAPSVKPERRSKAAQPAAEGESKVPTAEPEASQPTEAAESATAVPEPEVVESPSEVDDSEQESPRQPVKRSFEEEARDFVRAARPTQLYDSRDGSVTLSYPLLPDLGEVPWRHQGTPQKHLPMPTRRFQRRPDDSSTVSRERATVRPGRERTKFVEVERAPVPYTSESAGLAPEPRQVPSDPGLAPPDAAEGTVALDPVAEAKAVLLESGPPKLEVAEPILDLPPVRSGLPFRLEPTTDSTSVAEIPSLDALRRWVSAYRRGESDRVDRERRAAEAALAVASNASERVSKADQADVGFALVAEQAPGAVQVRDAPPVSRTPKPVTAPAKRRSRHADDYEYTVPVVMPTAMQFPLLATMRRHLGKVALVLFVAGAIAAAVVLGGSTEAVPDTTPYVTPPVSAELLDFTRSGDELSRQISTYEVARAQFDAGEIECAGLASAQVGVSQAFVSLAENFATMGSRLSLRERLDYERLAGSARSVTNHFETAGCTQTP